MDNILHAIDYNGGQIFVDKEKHPTTIGELSFAHQFNIVSTIKELVGNSVRDIILEEMPHNGTLDRGQLYKVVAKSPNLSLEGIPYVEIEEDVESIVREYTDKAKLNGWEQSGFRIGYKAASAKKYNADDLRNAFKAGELLGSQNMQEVVGRITQITAMDEDEYINSIHPKVVSIGVDAKPKLVQEWGESTGLGTVETSWKEDGIVPVTYSKDGKTFLKVKSIQYEN